MDIEITGELVEWRGPAPYHFVRFPDDAAEAVAAASSLLTSGWGGIPARATCGGISWTTSLFPKDGGYLLPVTDAARKPLGAEVGDVLTVRLSLGRDA